MINRFYEVYLVLSRMFCPRDEIEESVIVLLLSEAMVRILFVCFFLHQFLYVVVARIVIAI